PGLLIADESARDADKSIALMRARDTALIACMGVPFTATRGPRVAYRRRISPRFRKLGAVYSAAAQAFKRVPGFPPWLSLLGCDNRQFRRSGTTLHEIL